MVMAGGTGGHVFPALAVAEELRSRGCEVTWLGAPDSFEARQVPQHGFAIDWVDAFRLRGQNKLGLLLVPFKLLRAMSQAWRAIRGRRPQVLLGMGGFVTGPGGLVARLLRLPLVIHEQNAIPGMTNQWLARIATAVLEAFPGAFPAESRAQAVGNPVRKEIAAMVSPDQRLAGRSGAFQLLVIGGSLGADALNQHLPETLALMAIEDRPRIRHQTGRGKFESTLAAYRNAGVEAEVSEFIEDMAEAYSWADLVVCRAGALTVSELAAVGVGAILVPFPHAVDDHQTLNARYLTEAEAGVLIQQRDLDPQRFADVLSALGKDRQRLLSMAQAARRLARLDAAERVADICERVAA